MPKAARSFPAFDEWQRMSEGEQDALLDALEAAQRRGSLSIRLLVGLLSAGAAVVAGGALLALW